MAEHGQDLQAWQDGAHAANGHGPKALAVIRALGAGPADALVVARPLAGVDHDGEEVGAPGGGERFVAVEAERQLVGLRDSGVAGNPLENCLRGNVVARHGDEHDGRLQDVNFDQAVLARKRATADCVTHADLLPAVSPNYAARCGPGKAARGGKRG